MKDSVTHTERVAEVLHFASEDYRVLAAEAHSVNSSRKQRM
jgi:hypothetical protein